MIHIPSAQTMTTSIYEFSCHGEVSCFDTTFQVMDEYGNGNQRTQKLICYLDENGDDFGCDLDNRTTTICPSYFGNSSNECFEFLTKSIAITFDPTNEPTVEPTRPSKRPIEPYEPETLPDNDSGIIIGAVIGCIFFLALVGFIITVIVTSKQPD